MFEMLYVSALDEVLHGGISFRSEQAHGFGHCAQSDLKASQFG
jgi:hypothetical protein